MSNLTLNFPVHVITYSCGYLSDCVVVKAPGTWLRKDTTLCHVWPGYFDHNKNV